MKLNPLTWFGVRRTTPEPEPAAERLHRIPGNVTGVTMFPDEALQLSAVWACVTVIAKALASCVWDVFEEDDRGNRQTLRGSRLWSLLNVRPNDEMTPFAWREAELVRALICGNAYSEIERDGAGRPYALWPLDPERCELQRNPDTGRLELRVSNYRGPTTYLDYRDVFHLHGPSADGVAGYDTVIMALRLLAQVKAAEIFGSAFYGNGTSFGGVLTSENVVGEETVKSLRDQLDQVHRGPDKAFKVLIAGGGLKFSSTANSLRDSQFIEQRHHMIEEVCRWFGVPPHKIAHLLRSTNNNIEHQGLEFVRDALTPWAERLRQEADFKLVPARRLQVRTRLETEWLAEGDAKSKAEADATLFLNGLMTTNEIRRRRGLNTLGPAGDRLYVQQQMVPLDVAAQQRAERPANADDASSPGDDDSEDPA